MQWANTGRQARPRLNATLGNGKRMKKRLITFLVVLVLLPSCCLLTTYDKPTIYKAGYSPGVSKELRTDGFYYYIDTGRHNPRYSGYVHPIFFYSDGSVAYCSSYESINALLADLPNASCRIWGFYRADGNHMTFEIGVPADGFSSGCHVGLSVITATLSTDTMTLIEERDSKGRLAESNEYLKAKYQFYPYNVKPDPRYNWIRDNTHYKLEK